MREPINQVPFTFTAPNGSKYECYFRKVGKLDGICYDPTDEDPKIFVTPKMSARREMNTCIHEAAHAFFWDPPSTLCSGILKIMPLSNGTLSLLLNTSRALSLDSNWCASSLPFTSTP